MKSTLKAVCKKYGIKNISTFNIKQLFQVLYKRSCVIKIQRFIRKVLSNGEAICPLTLEPVKCPCFAFKPMKSKYFIYYNLQLLHDYLIESGNFVDPKTREVYPTEVLDKIDKELKRYGIKCSSLVKASKNVKFYRKKKEREHEIMMYETFIDDIIASIRQLIDSNSVLTITELNLYHFNVLHDNIIMLHSLDKDLAALVITRTVSLINYPSMDNIVPNVIRDYTIQDLLTLQCNLYGDC